MCREMVAFGPGLSDDLCRLGSSQRCCSGCRCLFEGSAVVVLVPCESSSTGEGLLAVGERALVRSLALMGLSVTG
jgi:hypothetical protein